MLSLGVASLLTCVIATLLLHRTPPARLSEESARLYHASWALVKEKGDGAWLQVAAMMDAALQGQPGQPELHQLRGIAYRAMGLNGRAIEDLTAALAARPDNGLSFYNRGSAYNALGQYRKAIADQDKAIQLAPTDPSRDLFYQERGIAFKKLGRSGNDRSLLLLALADFNEVLKLNPRKGYAWHERGSVWVSLEEPVKALADFNTAEGFLSPENRYWLYKDRADVKQRLGDYQGASADRKRSDQVTEKR